MNETKIDCKNLFFTLSIVLCLQPMLWSSFSLGDHLAGRKHSIRIHLHDSDVKLCLATRRLEKVLPHQGKFLPFFLDISWFTSPNWSLDGSEKTLRLQQLPDSLYAADSHFIWISFQKKHSFLCVSVAPEFTQDPRQKQKLKYHGYLF